MKKFKILVTSTSFQDSNGSHHELLAKKKWDLSFMRGPLNEIQLLEIIDKYDGIICGDDSYTKKVLKKGKTMKKKMIGGKKKKTAKAKKSKKKKSKKAKKTMKKRK